MILAKDQLRIGLIAIALLSLLVLTTEPGDRNVVAAQMARTSTAK